MQVELHDFSDDELEITELPAREEMLVLKLGPNVTLNTGPIEVLFGLIKI